ncbi:2Fe-2S iron-sulfur cluster-binding protein [Streptomyces sp. NPDC008001]|uniref:2Fe-2S iron-sulfur cluster-binding protein n=1 Tax=Streptomyces sp. NPDC008001 TaxID=3364804 RepID=UPI0036E4C07D
MSDEQRQARTAGPGGWQPVPGGGEYDEGTTFLQLPPELLAHPGAAASGTGAWDPLAAAGSGGYTPPPADSWQHAPSAAGTHGQYGQQGQHGQHGQWGYQQAGAPAGDAHADDAYVDDAYADEAHPAGAYTGDAHYNDADPHDTAQWPVPGDGSTGQWSVPVVGDDPVDESGEYLVHGGHAPESAGAAPGQAHAPAPGQAHAPAPGQAHAPAHDPAPAPWAAQPVDDSWRQSLAAATPAAGTPVVSDGGTGQWSVPVAESSAVPSASAEPSAAPAVDVTGAFTVPQYVTDVTGTGDNPAGAASDSGQQPAAETVETAAPMVSMAEREGPAGAPEPSAQPQPQPQQQPLHAGAFPHQEGRPEAPSDGHAEVHADGHSDVHADAHPDARPDALPEQAGQLPGEAGQHAQPTLPQDPAQPPQPPQPAQPTLPEQFVPPQGGPDAAEAVADAAPAAAPAEAGDDSAGHGSSGHDSTGHDPVAPDPLGHDPLGSDPLGHDPLAGPHTEHPCTSYVLRVNGTDRPVTDAWIGESLLYVLRERLGLAGAKDGCSQGECGACSVQVDGRLVASCLVPAATAAGSEVRTVEGLAVDGRPSDVQRALAECGAVQCGFCVPGMAMTMHDLLEGNHAPTELETRQALCGNLCRCSGYRGVLDAVRQVVDEREAAAAHEQELQQDLQDTHQQHEAAQPDADQARIPHQAGPHGGGSGKATA